MSNEAKNTEIPADNAERPAPVRVGLIADADRLASYLTLLDRLSELKLTGVAGMPRNEAPEDVPWYDDHRVMIAQESVELLMVDVSTRDAVNICESAISAGLRVWRRPPLGRNFAEAVEVARKIEQAGGRYRIGGSWSNNNAAIAEAWRCVEDDAPVFSEIRVSAAGPPLHSWRSSLVDAGGGVLVADAYDALEALCGMRGLPETVFASVGKCRDRASNTPRETEDMAAAVLKYDDGGTAVVHALWDAAPTITETRHFGVKSGIRYDANGVSTMNNEDSNATAFPADALDAELKSLAVDIRAERDEPVSETLLELSLIVSAVLEAIYLSGKTGQPEDPRRLFEVQKWPLAGY